MIGPILVINPNSSVKVTEGLAIALERYTLPDGPRFECLGIPESPATIASEEDVARSGLRVAEIAAARPDASAIIIACFSDPGLDLARSLVSCPVIGIQEAGILTALARADRFGIVALSPKSVARHMIKMRRMGVLERLAAEEPLMGVSAEDAGHSDAVFEQTVEAGLRLKQQGAGAIVLGCAGFAPRRAALEARIGISVIEPVQAAAGIALSAVLA